MALRSQLTQTKSLLISNGYNPPPNYIGLHNSMFLYCQCHIGYDWHTLYVKSSNDYRYVCNKCNCSVEQVG